MLRGKVPDFKNISGNGDIQLAFTIEGEKSDIFFPNKEDSYAAKSVTCEGGVKAEWDNKNWSLKLNNSNQQKQIKCTVDFTTSYNTVTYIVDSQTYEETVAKTNSILNPNTFDIPEKAGYLFAGWSQTSNGFPLDEYYMEDGPITVYARYVSSSPVTFSYSGNIGKWIVPANGLYKITAIGAGGGNGYCDPNRSSCVGTTYGGTAGSSVVHVNLKSAEEIFYAIGGAGLYTRDLGQYSGAGYNGGGNGCGYASYWGGGGGGATHFSKESGLLKDVSKGSLLVVAGGGGGAGAQLNGDSGGGSSGSGSGGTQTSGCAYGYGCVAGQQAGGGGGGLYGGQGGGLRSGGGGGSGYIPSSTTVFKGVSYTNVTQNGKGAGAQTNGSASIQLIAVE